MNALTVGSLFAGIGGFDLGLERAGMRSVWQSEIDPYCQRVLEKHWPDVLRVPDVRDVGRDTVPYVDVICGGFPCQDISVAGRGAGIRGEKSGLWSEMFRVVDELRPRYLVVENVAALVSRGLDVVLADLASIGFDAEWDCLRASDFGAPHIRNRFWLVAYPGGEGRRQDTRGAHGDEGQYAGGREANDHIPRRDGEGVGSPPDPNSGGCPEDVGALLPWGEQPHIAGSGAPLVPDAPERWREPRRGFELPQGSDGARHLLLRAPEPVLPRVDARLPDRMDRTKALGNSLVPQIAEWIGHRIVSYEAERSEVAA